MNIYKKILDLLDSDIDLFNDYVAQAEKEINKNSEVLKFIKLINSSDEIHLSQIKSVAHYYPELSQYVDILQEIELLRATIENGNYDEVIEEQISVVSRISEIDSEIAIKNFTLCKKLKIDKDEYLKLKNVNSRVADIIEEAYESIMKLLNDCYINIFNKFKSEIEQRYHVISSVDVLRNGKELTTKKIHDLQKLRLLFNEDGLINDVSEEDLKLFYTWLQDIDYNQKIDIIKDIIFKQIKQNKKSNEEIVNENRKDVIKRIEDVISFKENFDNLDLSKFTEEEISIIKKVKSIYVDKGNQYEERVSFSNSELGDRKDSYFNNKKVEWVIILADIENNLLPNIYTNHEHVIEIFKFIIEINEREKKYQDYLVQLENKEKEIVKYWEYLVKLLDIDNLYDTTYDYLFDEKIDRNDLRYDGKYDYYNIRYFLRNDVSLFIADLENEINVIRGIIDDNKDYRDVLDLEDIKRQYNQIINEYHTRWQSYIEYQRKQYIEEEEKKSNDSEVANLVFCLNDISFNDEFDRYDEGRENEFNETLEALETISINELKKPFGRKGMGEIMYRSSKRSGSRSALTTFGNEFFTPYRYSGSGNYRTGLIMFPTCRENKEKLKEKYNLSNSFAVFGVFKIISVMGANHNQYHDFIDFINRNEIYLENIGRKFLNPETDIQELCDIIDSGLDIKENLRKHGESK